MAGPKTPTDPGEWLKQQSAAPKLPTDPGEWLASQSVHGMEQLGGTPPPAPKPPMPYNPVQRGAKMKGTIQTPALLKPMESGVNDVIAGVSAIGEEGDRKRSILPSLPSSKTLGGVSKIVRGAGQVIAPYALAANPVGMVTGAAVGIPTQMAVEGGAKAMGVPEGTAALAGDVAGVAAGYGATKLPGMAKTAIKTKLDTVDPADAIVQGLKPTANRTGFSATLQRSMPELKATEAELGKPIGGIDDLLAAIDLAKKRVWSQYKSIAGPQAKSYADASPVADAMDASIPDQLKFEKPDAAKQLRVDASVYRKPLTVEQLESFLKTTNDQLDAYYAKNPLARRIALGKNPDTAALEAKADAIRDVLYKSLDGEGEGAAPRELKQRYGSLLEMERAAWPRRNVANRQQPNSLSEQVGKWQGYGQMAKGAVKALTGNFSGGVADIAGGAMDREMASFLKDQQLSDTLVRKAFLNVKGAPVPVQAPPPFQPKALIGTGDIIPPPPADTSYVRGAPAMAQPPNPRRALPPASHTQVPPSSFSRPTGETLPQNTGTASDASFVRGVPVTINPATGKPWTPEELKTFPHYAKGGIIRHPELAIVGEDGPEAIVPLGPPPKRNSMPPPSVKLKPQRSAKQKAAIFEAMRRSKRMPIQGVQ